MRYFLFFFVCQCALASYINSGSGGSSLSVGNSIGDGVTNSFLYGDGNSKLAQDSNYYTTNSTFQIRGSHPAGPLAIVDTTGNYSANLYANSTYTNQAQLALKQISGGQTISSVVGLSGIDLKLFFYNETTNTPYPGLLVHNRDSTHTDLYCSSSGTCDIGASANSRFGKIYLTDNFVTSDADGSVTLTNSIPTHTGHGIILRDTNTSVGRAPKLQFESASRTWQIVGNNVENTTLGGLPDTVGQDLAFTQADDPDGHGYRLAIHGETGDLIVNPGLGTRDGVKDGVVRAGDRVANDSRAARTLTVRGGNATAGTGDGGDLILKGGTTVGGQKGDVFIPANAGARVDTPHTHLSSGIAPIYYDTTNNKLCIYNGAWKCSAAFN